MLPRWAETLTLVWFAFTSAFVGALVSCNQPPPPGATFFREPRSGLCFAKFDSYYKPVTHVPCTPEVLVLAGVPLVPPPSPPP